MKRLLFGTIILCMLFSAVTVFAEGRSYVGVRGGIFIPNSDKEDGLGEFDTGYNIEAVFGYKVHRNFAIEGGLGRYSSDGEWSEDGVTIDATASATPITLTAKGIMPVGSGKVELYGGGGLGYYFAEAEAKFNGFSGSDDASALGFHLVGGVDFNVSDKVAIGAEVKWFSVKPEFEFNGGEEEIKFGGAIINVGLKYIF